MDLVTQVQILDEAIPISFYGNVLRKGMNPSISPLSAVGKYQGRLGSQFGSATSLGVEKL